MPQTITRYGYSGEYRFSAPATATEIQCLHAHLPCYRHHSYAPARHHAETRDRLSAATALPCRRPALHNPHLWWSSLCPLPSTGSFLRIDRVGDFQRGAGTRVLWASGGLWPAWETTGILLGCNRAYRGVRRAIAHLEAAGRPRHNQRPKKSVSFTVLRGRVLRAVPERA